MRCCIAGSYLEHFLLLTFLLSLTSLTTNSVLAGDISVNWNYEVKSWPKYVSLTVFNKIGTLCFFAIMFPKLNVDIF